MKKNERQNGIVHLLRTRKKMTAADLAAYFEVSERTIYRDIDALSQLKVPIIAYEGLGGGYEIDSTYFMPSIKLNSEEILLMQMVLKAGEQLKIPNMTKAYKLLNAKIENALDGEDRIKAMNVISHVSFEMNRIIPKAYHENVLQFVFDAFWKVCDIDVEYYHPEKNERTWRRFSPMSLSFEEGAWYLRGYCHLRGEARTLRLDRIVSLLCLDERNLHINTLIPKAKSDKFSEHLYELIIDPGLYRTIKDDHYLNNCVVISNTDPVHVKIKTSNKGDLLNLIMTHPNQVTAISPEWFLDEITVLCKNLNRKYLKKNISNPDI